MSYNVTQNVEGNMVIMSTWDNKTSAKQDFHNVCMNLYADKNTTSGVVALLDDNLDVVDGCKEFIVKEVVNEA